MKRFLLFSVLLGNIKIQTADLTKKDLQATDDFESDLEYLLSDIVDSDRSSLSLPEPKPYMKINHQGLYPCPFAECNKEYKYSNNLQKHLVSEHFKLKIPCPIAECAQEFTIQTLGRHVCHQHPQTPPKIIFCRCEVCHKEGPWSGIIDHIFINHTGEEVSLEFLRHESYGNYSSTVHTPFPPTTPIQSAIAPSPSASLSIAQDLPLSEYTNQSPQEELSYSKSYLLQEGDDYLCPFAECSEKYTSKNAAKLHIASCHLGLQVPCPSPSCQLLFTIGAAKNHMSLKHKDTTRKTIICQCSLCPIKDTWTNVMAHIFEIHRGGASLIYVEHQAEQSYRRKRRKKSDE